MDLIDQVRAASAVVAVGGRTHSEIGHAVAPGAIEVRAPVGLIAHDAGDLTVTVGAGTTVAELATTLAERGQDAVLDAETEAATVGGLLATGLSGMRRLRYGPVRDRVLEVRFVSGYGRLVKGGGPTVKNVSGYDLPRLLVGSLGTLGILTQVTLRLNARPPASRWYATDRDPLELVRALHRPACVAWDGRITRVLLEGHAADLEAERRRGGLDETSVMRPRRPQEAHVGRIAVRPGALRALGPRLDSAGCTWWAEVGVGTVHVGAVDVEAFAAARVAARELGGWMLVEAGGGGLAPFGRPLPNLALARRVKAAFDPDGKLAPGRIPSLEATGAIA